LGGPGDGAPAGKESIPALYKVSRFSSWEKKYEIVKWQEEEEDQEN
jgi:hypothetical protein